MKRQDDNDFGMLRLPYEQVLEVFGPPSAEHRFMRLPVIAFDVANIQEARAELEAHGVEFVTPVEHAPSGETA